MTIPRSLSPAELNAELETLERAAPSHRALTAIEEASYAVRAALARHGFDNPGDDRCRTLDTAIFWYLRSANPHFNS